MAIQPLTKQQYKNRQAFRGVCQLSTFAIVICMWCLAPWQHALATMAVYVFMLMRVDDDEECLQRAYILTRKPQE